MQQKESNCNVAENRDFLTVSHHEQHNCTNSLHMSSTNNLDTLRDFSKFSRLSEVARFRNGKFSAKGIQNDMTLFKSKKGGVQNIIRKATNVLNTREKQWNEKQKELSAIHIREKMQKTVRQKDCARKLLETCKSLGGLCVTSDELIAAIDAKPGKQEQIVKTELTFYRNTRKSDMIACPDLNLN